MLGLFRRAWANVEMVWALRKCLSFPQVPKLPGSARALVECLTPRSDPWLSYIVSTARVVGHLESVCAFGKCPGTRGVLVADAASACGRLESARGLPIQAFSHSHKPSVSTKAPAKSPGS